MPLYSLDGVTPELEENCWIAPDAILIGKIKLKKRASIWFGVVLRGDNEWIEIGEDSNVQDHSIMHTDTGQPTLIGNGVTIGHRVVVHSARVGDNSLIGMGSILLNRSTIGKNCLVGAGSLVTEDKVFSDGKLIFGSPATERKDLTANQIQDIARSSQSYVANARRYRSQLHGDL